MNAIFLPCSRVSGNHGRKKKSAKVINPPMIAITIIGNLLTGSLIAILSLILDKKICPTNPPVKPKTTIKTPIENGAKL